MSFIDEPYTMLLASLPHLPPPGTGKDLPITRLQLSSRLKWLTPEDQQRLERLEQTLHWAQLPIELSDEQVIARAQAALEAIACDFLRPIILQRLETRTFVAALRRRVRGETPPRERPWGLGRFVKQIETHYTEPDFGLGHLYPWIAQAHKHLQADEPMELENLLLTQYWNQLDRVDDPHAFDFSAVGLYVLRWEILHRSIRRQPEAAMTRFDALVAQTLDASPISLESLT